MLRRIRNVTGGGQGDFHGPIGGHYAYPVPALAVYFLPNTLEYPWQDMSYPIYTRKILERQRLPGDNTLSQVKDSPPVDDKYLRVRTRIR